MPKKSYVGVIPRVPRPWRDVQANFCKNVECTNYRIPANPEYNKPDTYRRSGGTKADAVFHCKKCEGFFVAKSNRGIVEETDRLEAYLHDEPRGCPEKECPNHDRDISHGKAYYILYGKAPNGAPRYRCRECKKNEEERRKNGEKNVKKRVFAVNPDLDPIRRQKAPEKNERIFMSLVNKVPFNRIEEEAGTGGGTLYGKIDFFYRQCRAFAAEQERQLLEASRLGFRRLYLSTDAQEYSLNWKYHQFKQNVKLSGVGTADNWSGFVFAMNVNFDPGAKAGTVEDETLANNDYDYPNAFRLHARYWLRKDYEAQVLKLQAKMAKRKPGRKPWTRKVPNTLIGQIQMEARLAGRRRNVDNSQVVTLDIKLPDEGMQVARDYSYFAHFHLLKHLLADNFGKVRFFFDYDSGLRAACLTAWADEIEARRADACYVRAAYEFSKPAKAALVQEWENNFEAEKAKHPHMKNDEIETLLMIEAMRKKESDKYWGDWWIEHPHPSYNEPRKMMSFQTYHKGMSEQHLARLLRKASLHGVNQFFNFLRNRASVLSRQGTPASSQSREYLVNGAYNPAMIVKIVEILRVYYNYILPVKEHKSYTAALRKAGVKKTRPFVPVKERNTRAMYLGLCDRPYTVKEVLEFKPPAREHKAAISA